MTRMRTDINGPERAAHDSAGHASDADLLRILDHETPLSPLRDSAAHVGACTECSARSERLRQRRLRLASLLSEADSPVPAAPRAAELWARARDRRRTRMHQALRAAALIVVITGTLAAQPVVRRWVGAQWDWIAGTTKLPVPTPTGEGIPVPEHGTPGSLLAFDAGAGPLTIRYDMHPNAGVLTVIGDTGALVRVERVGGANLELLVSQQDLHVRNAEGAAASFVVRVPRTIGRVELRFGRSTSPNDVSLDLARETRQVVVFDQHASPSRRPQAVAPR